MNIARLPFIAAYVAILLCASCSSHDSPSSSTTPPKSEHVSPASAPPMPTPTKPAVDLMEPTDPVVPEPPAGKVAPVAPSDADRERVLAELSQQRVARARVDIIRIDSALAEYAINNSGRYPDTLEPLVTADVNGATYLGTTEMPHDPWGREYLYEPPVPGTPTPRVYTLGSDNRAGGKGEDADLDNASIREGR